MKTILKSFGILPLILFAAWHQKPNNPPVSADDIKHYLAVIASDSLQGRKPFTVGEERTISYLSNEFKKLNLQPGNHGSYYQDVPMVEITSNVIGDMQISGKTNITLQPNTDFVAGTRQEVDAVDLKNSPLVFAGYGVVAPEYNWNDYKGLDVSGKTVIVLVNDPGFQSGDPTFFHGDTMTYYGRWTYKYEEAARQGAAGVLIVHQTEAASYPWQVVSNSFTGAKLYLQQADKHMSRCKVEGWITEEAAKKILSSAGIDGDIRAMARSRSFKSIPLNMTVSLALNNKLKSSVSHNVVALLKGTQRPDEALIYSAHWDHFGIGKPDSTGDSIYNGAVDNGSGTAALLSVAKAFAQSTHKPQRSLLFLSVTGEEQGLLGSEYYATHPLFSLNKTVADLNMDALHDYGETADLAITGKGQNDLDEYVDAVAKQTGRHTVGDPKPGSGSYYRSDHFNFAKVGVPALDLNVGTESTTHDAAWGKQQQDNYTAHRYHQPGDNLSAIASYDGMAEVANVMYAVGWKLANETLFPDWKSSSEFKAIRDKTGGK